MSKTYVSQELRARLKAQAAGRCSYCRTSEDVTGFSLEVDHIIPEASGGPTTENNLCLACAACNDKKNKKTVTPDPVSGENVSLFHPKLQKWSDHFKWSQDGTEIIGLTPIGRATVEGLKLNHPQQVRARRGWVSVGWHPPQD